jgi:16S rRNA (guanine527-N7)-methyltransferase
VSDISTIFHDHSLIVSRETIEKFSIYQKLLTEYNQKFNLIGASTIPLIAERHFLDSAQLLYHIDKNKTLVDVGTGAGFPGLVLAILGYQLVTLVESSHKKCEFLKIVSRETTTPVQILCGRIEDYKECVFENVVSRAVAPIKKILDLTKGIRTFETTYYLLKGEKGEKEVTEAARKWSFTCARKKSITHSKGVIFILGNVKKNDKNHQHCKSKRGRG